MCEYTAKDFKKGQPRWCPGCGDHFFLASLHKAMAEIGVPPHQTAVISGIGCSSRLPHYMNTYGMNTIHGRAAAIATGCKVTNPELAVWQVSGDGDGLAIGGNHFIHANRRNINLNMILLNNRIYGLTKGQYSPTSPRGFVSKSSPYGTVEDPFQPAELCFGARGHFFARAVATDAAGTIEVLKAAYNHKGTSVCEILQNCVIFNNGTHDSVAKKEDRAKNAIYLEHGKPMLFGENNEYGLMQEGFGLKVVKLGENGITEKDILIHDAHCEDNTLQLKLALMEGPDFPIALGVICHMIFGKKIEKVTVALPIVSQVAILLIIGVVVAANGPKLFVASSLVAIPVVILHTLCGSSLGFGFSKLMYKIYPKGFRYAQQKAITFEVGMQDSALGATLALTSFATNPLAAVPSTFFSVWHNISGSILSSWWRNHDDKHEIHWDSDNGEKGSAKSTVSAAHPFDADKAAKVAA